MFENDRRVVTVRNNSRELAFPGGGMVVVAADENLSDVPEIAEILEKDPDILEELRDDDADWNTLTIIFEQNPSVFKKFAAVHGFKI